jgi:hypothetical protein
MSNQEPDWVLPEDPHGIIPVGWKKLGEYTVVNFPAPSGEDVLSLMVGIKYEGRTAKRDYDTTIKYITVLKHYLAEATIDDLLRAEDQWRDKKTEEFIQEELAAGRPAPTWLRTKTERVPGGVSPIVPGE